MANPAEIDRRFVYQPPGEIQRNAHDAVNADCKTTGKDPVTPGTRCMLCEGAGWV